jgi:hypothetical protein
MVMSRAIENAIEDEISTRVHERMTQFLDIISKNYSIRYQRLLNDLASMDTTSTATSSSSSCCGVIKSGKRCQKSGKYEGYCKLHMDQKPDIRVTAPLPEVMSSSRNHTHSLPPLFMAGCPACEASKRNSSKVL